MYVCVCHAVTETEVAASVESGASTVEAVGDYTGAGTSCGTCHDHIDEVILGCASTCALAGPSPTPARSLGSPAMQGDARVLEFLNDQLTGELTAINQYFLHAKMQENWGFVKLAAHTKAESIEEMHHAEILTDRILFLEGLPNYQRLFSLRIGQTLQEQFESDLAVEHDAVNRLRPGIEYMRSVSDVTSARIFEEILANEEEHIDYLETQLELLGRLGEALYIAQLVEQPS